jgi:hypothetical protein
LLSAISCSLSAKSFCTVDSRGLVCQPGCFPAAAVAVEMKR